MMENRVRFRVGEIEFEAEGSAEVIERERSVFLNSLLPAAINAIVQTRGNIPDEQCVVEMNNSAGAIEFNPEIIEENMGEKEDLSRTNLPSFLKKYGVLNDQDFVLISAHYDEKKNSKSSFSSEDVKQYYAESRRSEYSNISALLRELAKKGMIMDAPNPESKTPKQYRLTSDGLRYVEVYQPKEAGTERKSSFKVKKAKTKVESVYSNISADDLSLTKYPEVKSFKEFKNQMMIIMYIFCEEGKGNDFSTQDIEYIMLNILGLPATNNQIQGVFRRNKTWFKGEKDSQNMKIVKYRLLETGKDYVKTVIEQAGENKEV